MIIVMGFMRNGNLIFKLSKIASRIYMLSRRPKNLKPRLSAADKNARNGKLKSVKRL